MVSMYDFSMDTQYTEFSSGLPQDIWNPRFQSHGQ
jgi:hypothetical protein